MGDAERRRRRLRHHGDAGPPGDEGASGRAGRHEPVGAFAEGPTASTPAVHDDDGSRSRRGVRRAEPESTEPRARRTGAAEEGERGLRGLVGSGSSQVSVTAALRARDAARPTDADLAEAEARVAIVRRNWVPREELPRTGR
ncbi:hypothetical protein AB0C02_16950 [Micromonospora sp. NPDC048999]|uniref:hypothetical protein n=1 Tax=Micromonospora sp. NPDC048999 TaxID=3155391 RepID=UPI0033F0F671